MAARGFDPTKDPTAIDTAPKGTVTQAGCFAVGCTMPGTMRVDGGGWTCAWHYGCLPRDIPRVTQALKDWDCISYEIRVGRRALTGESAMDPKTLDRLYGEASDRLVAATAPGGWGDEFKRKPGSDYRAWINGLCHFLGQQIAKTLGGVRA